MKYYPILSGKVIQILILACLILTACSPVSTNLPTPASTAIATRPSNTATLAPTQTGTAVPLPTQTATPAPSPTLSPTPLPTFTAATAKTTLVAAFHQLANVYPFRITDTERGLADVIDVTTDYAAADRYHTTSVGKSKSDLNETITIGNKTWWKINGKWDPTTSGAMPQNNFWGYIPKAQSVAYTGQDIVDGVACFIFSFKLDIQSPGLDLVGTGKAWVGISDGLPHQFDFFPGAHITGDQTHQIYTYGITVDIQQPVP